MTTVWLKLGGFALALGAVFVVAGLAGRAIEPDVSTGEPAEHGEAMSTPATAGGHAGDTVPGLAVASGGYTLELARTTVPAGPQRAVEFRITGADGEPVTEFDTEHEREMHLIVVRRDFENFQHLHPRLGADGTWRAEADLARPGDYRVFADFVVGGEALTLASDLFVPGRYAPRALPAPTRSADAGDGYRVRIDGSEPVGGETATVEFTVGRHGREVAAVEPYLGADGHLVALREGDQAFLHTHPEGEAGGPGPIVFDVEYPTPGRYRLFLQFKHRGEVRTAAFTQEATRGHG